VDRRHVLVATDLSERCRHAVRRAALLARQFEAGLTVLHVVDDAQPPELADAQVERAQAWLARHSPADTGIASPEVLVRQGDPYAQILAVANERDAAIIVLGEHRRRLLLDAFLGTTAERLLRVSTRPVLIVHQSQVVPYGRVHLAVDLSETSAHAMRTAARLDLLGASATAVHVFSAVGKGKAHQAGVDASALVASERVEAAQRLASFLSRPDVAGLSVGSILLEGRTVREVARFVEEQRPQLLVLGTRARAGVKRAVLGSVAEALIRSVSCDVLAVPPPPPQPG
jgi:universal stress protein E